MRRLLPRNPRALRIPGSLHAAEPSQNGHWMQTIPGRVQMLRSGLQHTRPSPQRTEPQTRFCATAADAVGLLRQTQPAAQRMVVHEGPLTHCGPVAVSTQWVVAVQRTFAQVLLRQTPVASGSALEHAAQVGRQRRGCPRCRRRARPRRRRAAADGKRQVRSAVHVHRPTQRRAMSRCSAQSLALAAVMTRPCGAGDDATVLRERQLLAAEGVLVAPNDTVGSGQGDGRSVTVRVLAVK